MNEWQNKIRVGYHKSNNGIKFTIPNRLSFPSTRAFFGLRDHKTIVLSPNPFKGAIECTLRHDENIPGCRVGFIGAVRGIGTHFGMMPFSYSVEGENFVLAIPPENERRAPRQHKPKCVPLPALEPSPRPVIQAIPGPVPAPALPQPPPRSPMERVCLEGYGSTFLYDIPLDRMLKLIDELARYRTDG